MPELLKTTKDGSGRGHYHIVYVNEETGQGLLTEADGHVHELEFAEPMPDQVDPQTGEVVVPGRPGGWVVVPGEDGHTHELEEYELYFPSSNESDDQKCRELLDLYRHAKTINHDSMEAANESEDFYRGDQWSEDQKSHLKGLDRAALVVNQISSNIDTLIGIQVEQRTDIKYLPQESSDQITADVYNVAARHVLDQCYYQREKTKTFTDQSIRGLGVFNLYVDFEDDIRGEIKVERFNPREWVAGPHEKDDLSDCEYVFKKKMYSEAKVAQLWPKKAKKLKARFTEVSEHPDSYSYDHHDSSEDSYSESNARSVMPVTMGGEKLIDIAKKEVMVLECWRRIYQERSVVINQADDFYFTADGWRKKDIRALEKLGFVVITQTVPRMRITKYSCGTILSDEDPADLPVNDFFFIPVYAKKRGNDYWGKVEEAKDAQRGVNKRYSQSVDIGNKMCAYGWFIDEQTFVDSKEEAAFRRKSTSPGFVSKLISTDRPPRQVEGVKFPSELVELMRLDMEAVSRAMNVIVEQGGANESASHLMHRTRAKLKGNEYLFDNMAFAEQKLGRLLASLIQRYYTPDRLYRLVERANQANEQGVEVGGMAFDEISREEIVAALEIADVTKFDIIVSEAEASPSIRMATSMFLSELAQSGFPVPPEAIFENMDIPEAQRRKLMESLAAQQEAEASAGSDQALAEENKTLIARGIIPPSVKMRLDREGQEYQQMQQPQAPDPNQTFPTV